jgi:hypothetical protein
MDELTVEEIIDFLSQSSQLRVAECLAPWTHGTVE